MIDQKAALASAVDAVLGALSDEISAESSGRVRGMLLTLSDLRLASELSPNDDDLREAVADMEQVVLIVMEQERLVREKARCEAVYNMLSFAARGAVSAVVAIAKQVVTDSLEEL